MKKVLKSIYLKLAGILNKLPFNNSFKLRGTKLTYKGARLLKCKFDCNGKNNKIIIEKDALLRRCVFKIDGNNNTVHIGKNTIVNDTEFYLSDNNNNITLGDKTWICGKTNLNCLEGTTIKTGEECLFSSEIVLRTSREDASRQGAFEALLVDDEGLIREGSRSNFYIIKGNVLTTAPDDTVLDGVTRISVLRAARELGYSIEYRRPEIGEIFSADSSFISSTSMGAMPIKAVDGERCPMDRDKVAAICALVRKWERE